MNIVVNCSTLVWTPAAQAKKSIASPFARPVVLRSDLAHPVVRREIIERDCNGRPRVDYGEATYAYVPPRTVFSIHGIAVVLVKTS